MKVINFDDPVIQFVIVAISMLVIFPIGYFLGKEAFLTKGYWKVLLVIYILTVVYHAITIFSK